MIPRTPPGAASDRSDDAPGTHLALRPGHVLGGRYEVGARLGVGGIGEVYEARHVALSRPVAVKVLRPWYAEDPEARARFSREGEAAARVRHPHAVEVFDVGEDGATQFLVMERLDGEDLARRLASRGAMGVAEALDVLLPVLSAVAAAHDAGVVHRDLKCANVFLARGVRGEASPKVVDFGISRVLGDDARLRTSTASHLGTPAYMAPELTRSARAASPVSDQYALGVMLYECLAGAPPFEGDGVHALLLHVAEGRFRPLRVRRPDVPHALEAAVHRAMALDPGARFPSVRAFGAALLPFASPAATARWREEFGGRRTASLSPPPAGRVRGLRGLAAAAPLALGLASGALARRATDARTGPQTFVADVRATPAGARVELDGEGREGAMRRELPTDGRPHHLRVRADGRDEVSLTFVNVLPLHDVALRPSESAERATAAAPPPPTPSAPVLRRASPAVARERAVRPSTRPAVRGPNGMPDLE